MDVVNASICFNALSLSKLVVVVVLSVLATNAGSFVSNKFSICLSKLSGACHGESKSIGLYNNMPWTVFLVLVCAPATDADGTVRREQMLHALCRVPVFKRILYCR